MTIKAAVIGHPVGHSKSPLIHNYWLEKYGLEGSCRALDIAPERLEDELKRMVEKEGYRAFNLTLPHKEKAFALCAQVDERAAAVGAANVLVHKDDGFHGTNTDIFGFIENIKRNAPDYDFSSGRAFVLGAGGAARAVIYGLVQEGAAQIYVSNRTRGRAQDLADLYESVTVIDWTEKDAALGGVDLLVNTTSLGMEGQPHLALDLSALPLSALVTDIVYAPLYTDLLSAAQVRGNPIVTGIGMLLHQARPVFEAWSGILPEVDGALTELVLK